eukprot:6194452-Pleurochrysis_carterae.AAC.1
MPQGQTLLFTGQCQFSAASNRLTSCRTGQLQQAVSATAALGQFASQLSDVTGRCSAAVSERLAMLIRSVTVAHDPPSMHAAPSILVMFRNDVHSCEIGGSVTSIVGEDR